jgi:hypothetical protein
MFDSYVTTYRDHYLRLKQVQLKRRKARRLQSGDEQQKERQAPSLRLSKLIDSLDLSVPRFEMNMRNNSIDESTKLFLAAERFVKDRPNIESSVIAEQLSSNRERKNKEKKIKPLKLNELKRERMALQNRDKFRKPKDIDYNFTLLLDREAQPPHETNSRRSRFPIIKSRGNRPTTNQKKLGFITGYSRQIAALEKSISDIDKRLQALKMKSPS